MAGFVNDAVNLYGDAYKRMGKAAGGLLSDATNRFGSNVGYIGDYLSEGLLKPRTSSVPPNVLPPDVRFDQNLRSFGDAIRPQLTPQGTNSTADFFSNLLGQDQKEAAILAGTGVPTTTPPPSPPEETPTAKSETQPLPFTTTEETKKAQEAAKSLQEVQVTAQRRKMAEQHNVLATRTREQLLSEGADEKQLEGWDKFADQFDLTTVGLALLANNDGGDVFANLGKALLLGKAQKDQYRTEDLEQSNLDRTFLLDVFNKESQVQRRADETRIGDENVKVSKGKLAVSEAALGPAQQRADAATIAARAAATRAQQSLKTGIVENKAVLDSTGQYLENKGVGKDMAAGAKLSFATEVNNLIRDYGLDPSEAQEMLFEDWDAKGKFPTNWYGGYK